MQILSLQNFLHMVLFLSGAALLTCCLPNTHPMPNILELLIVAAESFFDVSTKNLLLNLPVIICSATALMQLIHIHWVL